MTAATADLLLKCLELTRYVIDKNVDFGINVRIGEGVNEFNFNFKKEGTMKHLSPSQTKRNFERRNEYVKKFKSETGSKDDKTISKDDKTESEANVNTDKRVESMKTAKFKVAANMRTAAQKVLETAISRVNPRLSRNVKYIENESNWDIGGGGRFAHELMFEITMDTDGLMETIVDGIQKNWRHDPLPAELMQAWLE